MRSSSRLTSWYFHGGYASVRGCTYANPSRCTGVSCLASDVVEALSISFDLLCHLDKPWQQNVIQLVPNWSPSAWKNGAVARPTEKKPSNKSIFQKVLDHFLAILRSNNPYLRFFEVYMYVSVYMHMYLSTIYGKISLSILDILASHNSLQIVGCQSCLPRNSTHIHTHTHTAAGWYLRTLCQTRASFQSIRTRTSSH